MGASSFRPVPERPVEMLAYDRKPQIVSRINRLVKNKIDKTQKWSASIVERVLLREDVR